MRNFEEGALVEFSNSANTRRVRGRVAGPDPADPERLLVWPSKVARGREAAPVSLDPEGAAMRYVDLP